VIRANDRQRPTSPESVNGHVGVLRVGLDDLAHHMNAKSKLESGWRTLQVENSGEQRRWRGELDYSCPNSEMGS